MINLLIILGVVSLCMWIYLELFLILLVHSIGKKEAEIVKKREETLNKFSELVIKQTYDELMKKGQKKDE